jgi:NAD(P)-dependent dehydrogenase (short-subunit alcohol dehydrogenase family)
VTVNPQHRFEGRVVIVTGASSGIGRAAARAFAAEGAAVVAVARDAARLQELAGEVSGAVHPLAIDVVGHGAAEQIVEAAVQRGGGVDVLVNAAGIIANASTEATPDEMWQRVMALNLEAPFRLMRAAFAHLQPRKGNVVNVSSVNGRRVFPGLAAYNTSKAALDQLTRSSAIEWASHGVRVNAVSPGVTVTNLHRRGGMDEAAYEKFLARAKETHPLGRPGQADEVASLILFLASDAAAFITGETIAIDGGRHLTCAR